ncbi:protein unc-13 homolog D [Protopterus annectens]|uniref:protein unc-13 homolog D n=1 Tax=Protopterus annectens TaxID=7888 RepID=UPI001CFB0AC2|nr:protein unc-13 homolog D [Protopterus annectens]
MEPSSHNSGEGQEKDGADDMAPPNTGHRFSRKELTLLYEEVLYTIIHRLGKPDIGDIAEEHQLMEHVQKAFNMEPEEHYSILMRVRGLEHPTRCLKVTVKEAKEILGKDASGFSDPYCLLGIQTKRDHSRDESPKRDSPMQKKKRKAVVRDTIPDEQIKRTEMKKQTLNPVWNETFVMEFDDPGGELHMDMWDSDDVESVRQKLIEMTDLHGLKRIFKEARKDKGQDDFLGNIVIKLKDLRCFEDKWYTLEPRTETYPDRGQCHLQLKFIHQQRDTTLSKESEESYTIHRNLLQQFVQYDITQHKAGSTSWNGELSKHTSTILLLHATQHDLPPFHQDLAKWLAYSKLYQSLEFSSSFLLQQLTSIEYQWFSNDLELQHKSELKQSFESLLSYGLRLFWKFRDVFPPTVKKSTERMQSLLRVLVQMCKMKAFQELCDLTPNFNERLIIAIKTGTIDWFYAKNQHLLPMVMNEEERVKSLVRLTDEVSVDLESCKKKWNNCFFNTAKIDLFSVCYVTFDGLIAKEVKKGIADISALMSPATAEFMFQLYVLVKDIHKRRCFLQSRESVLELTDFHCWFREALPKWLEKAYTTAMERVKKAIKVDQLKHPGDLNKHSSSAVDLALCFTQIRTTLQRLEWPEPEEAFMIMVRITEDMCKIAKNYCEEIQARAEEIVVVDNEEATASKLCVVVNNIEQLRLVILKLPEQLDWENLERHVIHIIGEDQFQNTLRHQLKTTTTYLDYEIKGVIQTLAQKLHADINRHIHNLASANDSVPLEDTVVPLMLFLESELKYMNQNLVQENFNSLLAQLWTHVLNILTGFSQQQVNYLQYYKRLECALLNLEQCFHADGGGLPLETLHTDKFLALNEHLKLNTSSTRQLIQKYFVNKIQQQNSTENEKYGAVTIKGFYRNSEQKLYIEILNAVNLLPMDSNGYSDPFVQLTLEPKHIFPQVEMRTTDCKKNELNPLFDESFEFLVTPEQCQSEGACLMLTVFDYDTIGANDLEGEAFFSLGEIPGLDNDGKSVDNVSVPQTRLALTQPKSNEDEVLKILEIRKGDREAQAFMKLRKQRLKQSLKSDR